jgi:hypothetical protein
MMKLGQPRRAVLFARCEHFASTRARAFPARQTKGPRLRAFLVGVFWNTDRCGVAPHFDRALETRHVSMDVGSFLD